MMKPLSIRIAPIIVVALAIAFVFPCYGFSKATPYGVFDVYAPTATGYSGSGVLYGSAGQAKTLDGLSAYLPGLGTYVGTTDYVGLNYNEYWSPYSNRSAFPPDNATILSVSMLCVVKSQVTKPFTLTLLYGMGSMITVFNSPMYYATTAFQAYTCNITAITSWNASELKGEVPNWGFWVRVMSWADTGGFVLYVDYVGLNYTWEYPGGGGGILAEEMEGGLSRHPTL